VVQASRGVGATAEVLPPTGACARGVLNLEAPVADALGQRVVLLLRDLLEESVHDWIPFVAAGCRGGAFMMTTKGTDGFRHPARDAGIVFSAQRSLSSGPR
jgi:hypothetical protein